MSPGAAVDSIVRACYVADDDLVGLRDRFLTALRRVVPVDAAFVAIADPESLLFTHAWQEEPLVPAADAFLDVEFGATPDVNRFVDLANGASMVNTLDNATEGRRADSARYREAIAPLGLGDEMRVALRAGANTWGFLCLHRSGASSFTDDEAGVLHAVAPHVATAIRRIVAASISDDAAAPGRGVLIVGADHVVAMTGSAEAWLSDLVDAPVGVGDRLPPVLQALVRRLAQTDSSRHAVAHVQLPTTSGMLVTVDAARLSSVEGDGNVVVTFAPSVQSERAGFLMSVYDLTTAQRRVAALVLQGRTTRQIMQAVRISEHTVQDHLKVIFDKFGVRSRRDLVAAVFANSPPSH
jgi:DNA-binding CsgD family transcriptional regulator